MKLTPKKIILTAVIAVIVLFISGVSIYTNIQRANGNTLPMPFGVGMAVINSGSMEPNIPIDSLVIVVKADEYQLDDVVAFQTEKGKIHTVHRIVSIDGETITTCGDNNDGSNDTPFHVSKIKGKVVMTLPKVGRGIDTFSRAIQHPAVTAIILLVAGVLLFFSFRPIGKKEETDDLDEIRAEIQRLKAEQEKKTSAPDPDGDGEASQTQDREPTADDNQPSTPANPEAPELSETPDETPPMT